jgi:uncharacterized protein
MLVVTLLVPSVAQAQSFNCRTAERPDEILICQTPHLSRLDERMADLYFELRNSLRGEERNALEASQTRWLRSRFACGRDRDCIENEYERRIAQLRNL